MKAPTTRSTGLSATGDDGRRRILRSHSLLVGRTLSCGSSMAKRRSTRPPPWRRRRRDGTAGDEHRSTWTATTTTTTRTRFVRSCLSDETRRRPRLTAFRRAGPVSSWTTTLLRRSSAHPQTTTAGGGARAPDVVCVSATPRSYEELQDLLRSRKKNSVFLFNFFGELFSVATFLLVPTLYLRLYGSVLYMSCHV